MNYTRLISTILITVLVIFLLWALTPYGRKNVNEYMYGVQKADDATNYRTRKTVEDSCRSMMASYKSDIMIYEQYKDNDSAEKQSWGEQARIRANKTAAAYNEYVLKNSFVWDGNVPEDILCELPYI